MPGGFPIGLEVCNGNGVGNNTNGGVGVAVTSSSSANTLGSWTQLIASTPYDTAWVIVDVCNTINISGTIAVDIGIGSAGNEIAIVPSLLIVTYSTQTNSFSFPLTIPAGTRVSARCQATTGSTTCYVCMTCFSGSFMHGEYAGVDAIGYNSSTTLGTTVTASASTGVKGAYSQLVASAARDYMGYFIVVDAQNNGSSAAVNGGGGAYSLDIAIGSAGSEVVIDPDYGMGDPNHLFQYLTPVIPFRPLAIAAGQRIAARVAAGNGLGVSKTFGITLYGVY